MQFVSQLTHHIQKDASGSIILIVITIIAIIVIATIKAKLISRINS